MGGGVKCKAEHWNVAKGVKQLCVKHFLVARRRLAPSWLSGCGASGWHRGHLRMRTAAASKIVGDLPELSLAHGDYLLLL